MDSKSHLANRILRRIPKSHRADKFLCRVTKPSRKQNVVLGLEKPSRKQFFVPGPEKPSRKQSFVLGFEKPSRSRKQKFVLGLQKPSRKQNFVPGPEKPSRKQNFVPGPEKPTRSRRSWDRPLVQLRRCSLFILYSAHGLCSLLTPRTIYMHSVSPTTMLFSSGRNQLVVWWRTTSFARQRVSQCVCRISYTCLAVRADYFHDGISPER